MNSARRQSKGKTKRKQRQPQPKSDTRNESFFDSNPKRQRRKPTNGDNEVIDSDEESGGGSENELIPEKEQEGEVEEPETAAEKRLRIAREYVEKIKAITKQQKEDEEESDEEGEEDEEEGKWDSRAAEFLQKEQLESSGRARRLLASRLQKPEATDEFRLIQRHRESVVAVAITEDDSRGFSVSKGGDIIHWDVESGKREKYSWPSEDVLLSHGARGPQNKSKKRSNHVLGMAISSDGRYLATGGMDRHVHLWDTRTRAHIQAFQGHKGPVSGVTFRQGTPQLFSTSFDRTIKLWNAEDRCHIDTLHGHECEVLTVDCLRKERLLTVGRDRTARLWKVPEESQLVFRSSMASLECGCFINNEEFLSGSDDGSLELWSILRKKPRFIVKNAHPMPMEDTTIVPNGHSKESWVSSVAVCRGSDMAASGAGNGVVRLWTVESEAATIQPLYNLPLVGYVNSLAIAKSGRFVVAGVGKEPRLGRWGSNSGAVNGVCLHPLKFKHN
ncbi:U3 snoRNP-associated protein-like EMB2271 isoform X2 [Wolffia australiana]